MSRRMMVVLALTAICIGWFAGHIFITDSAPVVGAQTEAVAVNPFNTRSATAPRVAKIADRQMPDSTASSAQGTPAAPDVGALIAAIHGDDAAARSAAITALENAPKAAAVPVLREVLSNGSSQDQVRALQSLRSLALDQGDADGGIRNVFREAIYHGSDEAMVNSAQTTLDDVDGAISLSSAGAQ